MVRPRSILVVKLIREARGKILDLASYLAARWRSLHFSFKLGLIITLLAYLARNLEFDKTLKIFRIATNAVSERTFSTLRYVQQHSKFE